MTFVSQRPDHVPGERVFAVDIYDLLDGHADAQDGWAALRSKGSLIWTPCHGGHWIATTGALIEEIYRSSTLFSNRHVSIPAGKFPLALLPIQLDGLDHKSFRALIEPAFKPSALQHYAAEARVLARDLIGRLHPLGRCEFVSDFALVMPLTIFLMMVDLPAGDREMLHRLARRAIRSSTQEERTAAFWEMIRYLEGWIDIRRQSPGQDLLSRIVHASVDGAALTHEQVLGTAVMLLLAGLDTVAAMMTFVMQHLAAHPDHRRWLLANPACIASAAEELMRRHGVANNVRTATVDVELDGTTLRAGDMVVIPNCLHGLDDSLFAHAAEVDFRRAPAQTGTFGWGPHRCAGANLARMEMRILLEEWLPRIPEFDIDADGEIIHLTGTSNVAVQLPLRWAIAS